MIKNIERKIIDYAKYESRELRRISSLPRATIGYTSILGPRIKFTDPITFIGQYSEIFTKEIYKFKTSRKDSTIIDCGSNIGLSIIYFSRKYPRSVTFGFEPDPFIFEILKENLKQFEISNAKIYNKGIWNTTGKVSFTRDLNDSGHIVENGDFYIEVLSLNSIIKNKVDLLKLDIEGAELEAIKCASAKLKNVSNIFIEYHSHTDKDQELNTLLDIMKKQGFRFYIYNNTVKFVNPFLSLKEQTGKFDNLLNIFFYK